VRSRLVQHDFEEDYGLIWNLAIILQIEYNTVFRKCKEGAHMSCFKNHIMQPSLKI